MLPAGQVLGQRYKIQRTVGEGGMGAVYEASDLALDRVVALKVIRPELADDPEMSQRFKQELILARQVTHRNVIRIYDFGEADGLKFITMEFVEGTDLRTMLRARGKLSAPEAVEIIQQVCLALDAAHREKVIHRDLKPQNIMIDKAGRVLVMDFGLARSIQGEGMTQTGTLIGTLEYMSPEQSVGKPLDERSDLFTVGVIFYELLTGKSPYPAESAIASLLKRTQEAAVPISSIDESVPLPLSKIAGKCLEREPRFRYSSSKELLTDLGHWQGENAGAALQFPAVRTWGQARIPWRWIGAVLAFVVLAIIGFLVHSRMSSGTMVAGKPVSLLIADFTNSTSDPVLEGTLEPVFSTALEAAPFINAYKRGSAHRIAKQIQPNATSMDESLARLVAVREGVEVVVSGAIAREGESYRLSVRAVDADSGRAIAARELTVPNRDAILSAIGKLATPIRSNLGDKTPESAQLAAEESFTTSSLDAAHFYSLGQDAVEHGQLDEAVGDYQKAVGFDSDMGRAWAGLAVSSINMKKTADADRYYKKTLGLLDHMSEREQYRTLGTYYAAFLHNYPQAVETYQKLVFLYPGDTAGYNNLSIAYVFMLDFPKAIAAVKHAIDSNPHNLQWRLNYALYSMYAGDFNTAAGESERIIQENPSYQFAYLPWAISTLARGDADQARSIYARFEKVSPAVFSIAKMGEADLEMYFGHYRNALALLKEGIQVDEKDHNSGELALKYVAEGEADLALGRRDEAVRAAQKAVQLNSDESAVYPGARVLINAGAYEDARKIASTLDKTLQAQSRAYSQLIDAEINLQHGQFSESVQEIRESEKIHDSWISHFLLGRAYVEAAHYPEALSEFQTCKKRWGETADLMFADTATLRYLPPLYYWLGRAQQGVGMKAAARESYRQFLKLREAADPEDVIVVDAKKMALAVQ
ncbi:MAG TPA: protein kinase [Terriglobales bacterium]